MILTNCTLLSDDGKFIQEDLHMEGEKISHIGTKNGSGEKIDLNFAYVVAGLVDIHSHGAMNQDASDPNYEKMDILSAYYPKVGVTSWCPTTMTLSKEVLTQAVETIVAYDQPVGAKMAGIYLEGPFFHQGKKGAQAEAFLASPDLALVEHLREVSGDSIAVLALAPELEGGLDLISALKGKMTLSLGHTTADYDCAMAAFSQGATLVTHLYNAMLPMTHREPSILAAAADSGAFVELIADGIHVHPSVLRLTHRIFGKKICLVSDSIRCAGMEDGNYTLGGQDVMKKDGKVTSPSGTLAGSCVGLLEAVQNMIGFGIPPEEAFWMASATPAQVIGKFDQIGSLSVGKFADFLVLDQDFQLISTYVNGKQVYSAS